MPVFYLTQALGFPSPHLAEDGLVAVGGDLSEERLLLAYRMGIFPWYSEGEPILWWSPEPRLILLPEEFHVSKRLQRVIRQRVFSVTFDEAFEGVMRACAETPRRGQRGTWITPRMIDAYCRLHESGYAHSVECRQDGELAGGLYGVSLGKCFFGESMFSQVPNASKVALAALVEQLKAWAFELIDCQITMPHLLRLGAREVSRRQFMRRLQHALRAEPRLGKWRLQDRAGKSGR
jgi:leucyl/phenylalanyl-tRNA--protein transferase